MKRWLPLFAALLALTAQADIYKCRQANGQIEISNSPCPNAGSTLSSRPDETVSESNRRAAERDVERMRAYVDKREAAQQAEERLDAERQANASRNAPRPPQSSLQPSTTPEECLRNLDQQALEATVRAQLEAACRNNARSQPHPTYVPVYVPTYGGQGSNPVGQCIQNVMQLKLAPAEQRQRLAQCENLGQHPHYAPPPPRPEPKPTRPGDTPSVLCLPNGKNCPGR